MPERGPWRLTGPACEAFVELMGRAGLDVPLARTAAAEVLYLTDLSPPAAAAWHRPILAGARRQRVAGITLGRWVYLYSPEGLRSWPLLVHEAVHVHQYLAQGTPGFLWGYGRDWATRRLRGQDGHQAYLDLEQERQARAVEALATVAPPRPWVERADGPP